MQTKRDRVRASQGSQVHSFKASKWCLALMRSSCQLQRQTCRIAISMACKARIDRPTIVMEPWLTKVSLLTVWRKAKVKMYWKQLTKFLKARLSLSRSSIFWRRIRFAWQLTRPKDNKCIFQRQKRKSWPSLNRLNLKISRPKFFTSSLIS